MAIAQSTYSTAPAAGLPGQIANEEIKNIISRQVETSGGINFGQPAARSSTAANENSCRLMVSGGAFLGIAVLNRAVAPDADDPDNYPQYSTAALLTQGTIFVTCGATVVPGDDVYWDSGTGKYGTSSGGNNVAIPGARFETNGVADGVAVISVGNRQF
jgi:hypothetical protein